VVQSIKKVISNIFMSTIGVKSTRTANFFCLQAITLLLGPDNKLYYYEGEPNYKDYTSLKETTYGPDGSYILHPIS